MFALTNERYKTSQTGFSFYRLGHAQGVGLGRDEGGGVKNFSVGICDGVPSTARSSFVHFDLRKFPKNSAMGKKDRCC